MAFLVILSLTFSPASATANEITIAGFAFAGNFNTAADRFPYSFQTFRRLQADTAGSKSLSLVVSERTRTLTNPNLTLRAPETLVNLKSGDQALMAALVLSGETVSTENFGSYHKTFVNIRGDALIFDYKSQTVVRSYPLSVMLFDATPDKPTPERISGFVESLLLRDDASGLISQFVNRLSTASLPTPGTQNVQINTVAVAPDALALMPEVLRKDPKAVESMLADTFASILSARLGIPMLPSSLGHVAGTMSLRLENGDDYILKLGKGDFVFDLKLNRFAKIKQSETNVAVSYVYGAFANVHFYEPGLGTDFLNTDLKNGEVALIPAGQVSGDDFPAYQDAMRGVFIKLADALQKPGSKWIATAASAKDIASQIDATREILRKTK